ncbi:hypothetical protein [Nostoc sp.]|uniref:hypothetical protein n=1 Tax=Nostoc sp. TaxID=1180 RepID=UPI002FF881DA
MTDNSSFNQEESDKYKAAFKQLSNTNTIPLLISELAAFMLIAQLQLAFRHPNNIGGSRDVVRESIQPIVDYFTGDAREILERGFHSEFDIDTTPQPDPAWDYYETWQLLHTIKNKIDAALKVISSEERASYASDEKLKNILEPALDRLENVIDNHLNI